MIDFETAEKIANDYVFEMRSGGVEDLVVLKHLTIEKPYGWMFFYTSKIWYETGDFKYAIGGNAPFLVDKIGKIHSTGTAYDPEHYLAEFDKVFENVKWE